MVLGSLILTVAVGAQATEAPQYGIGRTPTSAEIAGWNIDVRADGAGLPSGHGAVSDGQTPAKSLKAAVAATAGTLRRGMTRGARR